MRKRGYDLCVLGGGPGGFAAAMRATDLGKRVALVEPRRIGGGGVYGALTSKSLWERAMKCPWQGLKTSMDEMQATAELRTLQMEHQLRSAGVDVIQGWGKFHDEHTILASSSTGGEEHKVTADHVMIATGSVPRSHPLVETCGDVVMNSDHLLNRFAEFPESMVIVGAGVIGCEFATILNSFPGTVEVRLIEKAHRILPREDTDVSRYCQRNLERGDCTFHLESQLVSMTPNAEQGHVDYVLESLPTGKRTSHRAEAALICIGRNPVYPMGLSDYSAGSNGQLKKYPHIYAVGDVTEDIALVSVAEMEARHAVELMFCEKDARSTHFALENISSIMFLDPCVASVGLNETQARQKQIPYKAARYGYDLVARGIAAPGTHGTDGFVKLLVTNDEEMRLIGVRALGPEASAITDVCSLLVRGRYTLKDLEMMMPGYPSIVEGLQEASRVFNHRSIFKPEAFPQSIKLTSWRPGQEDEA